jgi:hypothetical protein
LNRRDAIRRLAATSALSTLPFEILLQIGREARATTPATSFQTLSAHQSATLREVAEMILPRTDTPGADDASVAEFIDMLLTDWMDAGERGDFVAALEEVDRRARTDQGALFVDCDTEQRLKLLTAMDAEVAELLTVDRAAPADEYVEDPDDRPAPSAPDHPFYQLKRLTLLGYFTSEPGMTETLRWNPYPGRWEPCINIGEPS